MDTEVNGERFFAVYKKTWLETIVMDVLKCGEIPKHVAFIMDGNRRYAYKHNMNRAAGHKQGFFTLTKVLEWCKELNITHVTLYAFSLENFKRTQDEINDIMDLSRDKFDALLTELDSVNERGIRINIVGDIKRLPEDVQERVNRIHKLTANNNMAFLNVCLAYNSSHEMLNVIKDLNARVNDNEMKPEDITTSTIEQKLSLSHPFPDLFIRTSENRLSDFMIWQLQNSVLIFLKALWPEITIWDMFKAIFYFQSHNKFKVK